tara:strand:+ start:1425 stop:1925 length:501 start_codon:yes stop_codon:yes gene_type:complete
MDPIKVALAVASTAASAATAVAQGRQQEAVFDYNANINERNAKVADIAAEQLYQTEQLKIQKFTKEFTALNDATSQGFRYNGWMSDGGTPLLVALENASEADLEIQIMDYNARVGEQELKEKGVQERLEADLNTMYGDQARIAGVMSAGQSLLSGGADMYKTYKEG